MRVIIDEVSRESKWQYLLATSARTAYILNCEAELVFDDVDLDPLPLSPTRICLRKLTNSYPYLSTCAFDHQRENTMKSDVAPSEG